MYNDMLNDHRYNYLCVRNKVKKNTILNVSGKSRCVCCGDHNVVELIDYDNLWYGDYSVEDGEPDINDDDAFDYNARYAGTKKVMCTSCYRDHYCWYCGEDSHRFRTITIEDSDGYERKICEKCYTEKYKKCPTCGIPFYAYNKYAVGFIPNSCIFGLYQDEYDPYLDYEHDISAVLKTREPIQNRVMIFNECPECTKKRMEHSSRIEIPYDQKLAGKESFKNFTKKICVNNELVKDKEVKKYHYSNLIGFSKDDFYKIYKKS
jgi:hypothetical protein